MRAAAWALRRRPRRLATRRAARRAARRPRGAAPAAAGCPGRVGAGRRPRPARAAAASPSAPGGGGPRAPMSARDEILGRVRVGPDRRTGRRRPSPRRGVRRTARVDVVVDLFCRAGCRLPRRGRALLARRPRRRLAARSAEGARGRRTAGPRPRGPGRCRRTTGCPPRELDARRRRRHPGAPWASPRPARSSSTTAPARAAGRITLVPDHHVCIVDADQVVADVPDAVALLDARASADLDQRPVRDQRHRARPGRGRPRPPPAPRDRGRLSRSVSRQRHQLGARRAGATARRAARGPTQSGSFQFHEPNSDTSDGTSTDRTSVASSRMPKPEAGRHHLEVGARPGGERGEGQEQDQRRAGDQPAGAADALDHRLVGGRRPRRTPPGSGTG